MIDITFYICLFSVGIFFGSFANVVVLRLHKNQKGIINGRSECPTCKHPLHARDLIPLFSWIFLRGKCRYCPEKIPYTYPLGEATLGILWVFLLYFSDITFHSIFSGEDILLAIYLLLIGFFIHILFFADLYFTEVHRYISLPTIGIGLAFLPFSFTPHWNDAFIGALIPTVFFGAQIIISKYIITSRGQWVGEGDIDLGIIMGLILGGTGTVVALFLSYILGSIIGVAVIAKKGRKQMIPFGPFLLVGTCISLFWGDLIANWYLGILGF